MMPLRAIASPAYLGSLPLPHIRPPPLKYISTGRCSSIVFAGVHTLRYRQSSLIFLVPKFMSPKIFSCIGFGPYSLAWRTPCHFSTGCGAFQRRLPTGGAAKGMPLNVFTPDSFMPSSVPSATFTLVGCCANNTPVSNVSINVRNDFLIRIMI